MKQKDKKKSKGRERIKGKYRHQKIHKKYLKCLKYFSILRRILKRRF